MPGQGLAISLLIFLLLRSQDMRLPGYSLRSYRACWPCYYGPLTTYYFNFDTLNIADRKMILGQWNSDWQIYKALNFKNDTLVIGVNQNGEELPLTYMVNTKILTLKDNNGLKLEYVILDITEDKMTLRD